MNTHVLVMSKKVPLTADHLAEIDRLASRVLSFRHMAYESRTWVSPTASTAMLAWCNEPAHPQHAGLIHVEGSRAISMSGYVYDEGVTSLASLMSRAAASPDGRSFAADLPGVFAVTLAEDDRARTWNGLIPTEPVYWTETDDRIVVGTRAALVHLIGANRQMPEYDLSRFGSFLSCGYFASDATPFRNTQVLLPNSEIEVSRHGVRLRSIDGLEDRMGELATAPTDAFWDEMTERMLGTMRAVKSFGGDVKLHLSGGKDSRLLAGALVSAGVEFTARTAGLPRHPDVVGSRDVARILDLDHTVETPQNRSEDRVTTNILAHTTNWLLLTDCMINAWGGWTGPDLSFRPIPHFVGQGGEYYRGGWLKHPDNRRDLDLQKCRDIFTKKLNPNRAYIRPEAMQAYDAFLADLLPGRPSAILQGGMERAFAFTYGWHWAPPGYCGSSCRSHTYYPFCDSKLLRMSCTLPWQQRLMEEPHFNMMVRFDPELAYTPFTKFRWGFEADGPVTGRRPETWGDRVPRVPPANTNVTVDWKKDVGLGPLRDEFRAQIFENPRADAIFEALDRDRLRTMFESRTVFSSPASRFMWNVYAASVIVSNEWLETDVPGRPITVAVDQQWYVVRRKILAGLSAGRKAVTRYVERQMSAWPATVEGGATEGSTVDDTARSRIEAMGTRTAEIYLDRLSTRLDGIREAREIPAETLSRHLAEIKAIDRPSGPALSLAEVIAEEDRGVGLLTRAIDMDLDRAARQVASGGGDEELELLRPVDRLEAAVMSSLGVTDFDDVS